MKKILLAIALLSASLYANLAQADWEWYAADAQGGHYYYDKSTAVNRYDRGLVKSLWTKTTHEDGTYDITRQEINCTNRQWRPVQITSYMPNARVYATEGPVEMEWRWIPPDSIILGLSKKLCR